jgi:AraC-like DNA-binding protein
MQEIAAVLERAVRGLFITGDTRTRIAAIVRRMTKCQPSDWLLQLLQILILAARSELLTPLASRGYAPTFRRSSQDRLNVVCKYIHDHLEDSQMHQADLARLVGMHPSAFSRFFKSGAQRTVTDYINESRIGLASRLLLETELSVLEVCMRVGYENASNFNRRFRQLRGMSPRQYRDRHFAGSAAPRVEGRGGRARRAATC